MTDHLTQLEDASVFLIREAYANCKNLAMLWSMGKDSTVMMHLVRKAFVGRCPIPIIHIDTSYKIPEMIAWRDDFVQRHQLQLIVGQNEEALANGMGPQEGRLHCCDALKTQALLQVLEQRDIDGILLGVRRDEEGSRSKERLVSPRWRSGEWNYRDQPAEVWNYYNFHLRGDVNFRIHPLLQWSEQNIWEYILREQIPVIPLYFAKNGKRYRSLGCAPCTAQIASEASSVEDIIAELKAINLTERAGRAQDLADEYAMQKLRKTGYM